MTEPLPTVDFMHATQIAKPFHRARWIFEEKYDGWRAVAYKDADRVRLVSRNGRDLTHRFPEPVAAVGALPARTLILDGAVLPSPDRDPLPALDAFLQEHRDCDDLDAGMDAEHVWMACSCGAEMVHPLGQSGSPPLISTSPAARIVLPIIRTRAALTPSHRSRHNFPICTVGLRYSQGPPRI
jgi:hypothetical protein